MLVELHVVDLGIVADLDLVLGTGLTAITGETGATRRCWSRRSSCSSADAPIGTRARQRQPAQGRRSFPRCRGRRDGAHARDSATVGAAPHRRTACHRGGELAARGADLVDLHEASAHQSLLDPAVQRGARSVRRSRRGSMRLTPTACSCGMLRALAALGAARARAARRSTCCASKSTRSWLPSSPIPTRRDARSRRRPAAERPHAGAGAGLFRARRARTDAIGAAKPSSTGGRRSRP